MAQSSSIGSGRVPPMRIGGGQVTFAPAPRSGNGESCSRTWIRLLSWISFGGCLREFVVEDARLFEGIARPFRPSRLQQNPSGLLVMVLEYIFPRKNRLCRRASLVGYGQVETAQPVRRLRASQTVLLRPTQPLMPVRAKPISLLPRSAMRW